MTEKGSWEIFRDELVEKISSDLVGIQKPGWPRASKTLCTPLCGSFHNLSNGLMKHWNCVN